jgi:hypothetical protein
MNDTVDQNLFTLHAPPLTVGGWVVNPWAGEGNKIMFMMPVKPSRWKRFWHRITLGWKWEDSWR